MKRKISNMNIKAEEKSWWDRGVRWVTQKHRCPKAICRRSNSQLLQSAGGMSPGPPTIQSIEDVHINVKKRDVWEARTRRVG
jgi:hypothetical protein